MTGTPDLSTLRAKLAGGDGPRFWRSLDAVADSADFRAYLAAEFPSAARLAAAPERRGFLKLMAASFALGGLTACGAGAGATTRCPTSTSPSGSCRARPCRMPPRPCSTGSATGSWSPPATAAP
ncbi:TAT-variant-translocated molybdopterin oxidoreductase [Methylobacterium oryzae CBMB20]